jgi:hypothetical protein
MATSDEPNALKRIGARVRTRAVEAMRTPAGRWRLVMLLGVALIFGGALRTLFAPFFTDTSLYGFRDWDSHEAYRQLTAVSLLRYHELPFWDAWSCGGFPGWGYVEGATNLVSPYLPLYLALPVQLAVRYEIILSTVCALVFTYLLAGRVTKSVALRVLVAVAYGINGRWIMQASEGHSWHLQFSWLPLALYLFDVSLDRGKLRWALYAGMAMAMMVYMGGVYPLPHTALLLCAYTLFLTMTEGSARPVVSLAIAGVSSLGFSAPKLLPIFEVMSRYPRKMDSPESLNFGQLFSIFLDKTGTVDHDPGIPVPSYAWLEYGAYVGVWITGAMAIALFASSPRGRSGALRATGLVFMILGCGAFHDYAPWTLLHKLPGFSSQHVPSRFLLTGILLLMLAFAAFAGRWLDGIVRRYAWVDLVLLVPVYFIAADIAGVGLQSTKEVFTFKAPVVVASKDFHHVNDLGYRYDPDWRQVGRQQMLASYANTGVIRCYGIPHEVVPGAIAMGAQGYRGEAYIASGAGNASVEAWTPSTATVSYRGAEPGSTLVYNMNYDPNWRADGEPTLDHLGAVSTVVASSAGEVRFTYYPRTLNLGLLTFAFTVLIAVGTSPWGRRCLRW